MTGHSVGYLVGSIIFGIIFDKMRSEKTYCVAWTALALTVIMALIPWCSIYELMVGIHVLKGMAGGGLDTSEYFQYFDYETKIEMGDFFSLHKAVEKKFLAVFY